jgi:hypothetical protein
MDAFTPGIIGGIVGGIVAAFYVARMNKIMRSQPCPRCGQMLGDKKPGAKSMTQVFWGGWTCPACGCDVDRQGKERAG